MKNLLTFHGDKKNKLKYVNRMKAHIKADELIQGATGNGGHGCAVWCTLDRYDHAAFATEGIGPEWLARLYDQLFEGQTAADSKVFALDFLKALPIGVSYEKLDMVKWRFCAFLMRENIERVLLLDIGDDLKKQVLDAIRGVLALHEECIRTGKPAASAESAAWAARAESAARAAWAARAERAESAACAESAERAASAESAAWAASAESAARAAWAAWAAWAARAERAERAARAAWAAWAASKRYATELIRLLKEAGKTPKVDASFRASSGKDPQRFCGVGGIEIPRLREQTETHLNMETTKQKRTRKDLRQALPLMAEFLLWHISFEIIPQMDGSFYINLAHREPAMHHGKTLTAALRCALREIRRSNQ